MTTAIIGTGGIGSAIARQLAARGETLQLSSTDKESARKLAAAISGAAVADALGNTSLVVPSNPVGLDAQAAWCDSYRKGGSTLARLRKEAWRSPRRGCRAAPNQ